MHVYFSGIGGAGIGPLAQIAKAAGLEVSGSDKRNSPYIEYLKKHGIKEIHIGQTTEEISKIHHKNPIDWLVYSSAVTLENDQPPELTFCQEQAIKVSKRDEFLTHFLKINNLKMIAVAGTHGKTTTTAMTVWLLKKIGYPISYILPAKVNFGDMGEFNKDSAYFVYEADEFDHNFLSFSPAISLITGIGWDHQEIYPTRQDYYTAFNQFINQSTKTFIWQKDKTISNITASKNTTVLNENTTILNKINLLGTSNRQDAYLAIKAVQTISKKSDDELIEIINQFPGLSRRMEQIIPNLYSDYAHTPEKITAALNVASELAQKLAKENKSSGKIIIIYEPLTNRRQHFIKNQYSKLFSTADHIYWVPSYLAREDPTLKILSPNDLIEYLDNKTVASVAKLDHNLLKTINDHLKNNDLVVAISGGGGNSLDDWLRRYFNRD